MISKLARATQVFVGSLLGSIAVAIQAGNVLICVSLILFGFDVILYHLPTEA